MAAIAMHDGMSLWPKRSGPGCFAKHATLAAELDTDVTSLSRALARLIAKGYVRRERHGTDKRRYVLRIIPDELADMQQGDTGGDFVDLDANQPAEIVDPCANNIVDIATHQIGSNPPVTSTLYYSHGLDSSEDGLNSAQAAHLAGGSNAPKQSVDAVLRSAGKALRSVDKGHDRRKDTAKAGLGSQSIWGRLPANWEALPIEAQLQRFETATRDIDPTQVDKTEASEFEAWLFEVADNFQGNEPIGPWAQRLYENLLWEPAASPPRLIGNVVPRADQRRLERHQQ